MFLNQYDGKARFKSLSQIFVLFLFVWILGACDTPSSVGINNLDGIANPPQRATYPITPTLATKANKDVTGELSPALVGKVEEVAPLSGVKLEAIGYMDFVTSVSVPSKFKDGPITTVELKLAHSYFYGAKNTPLEISLYDMPKEWVGTGAKQDSLLTAGSLIMTHRIADPSDTTSLVIPLPDAWVKANTATLISGDFDTLFHGFQFKTNSGNSIIGLNLAKSWFRVVSNGEEIKYATSTTKVHTYVSRSGTANVPANQILLQDNTGDALNLGIDLTALKSTAISSSILRIYADTLSTFSTSNFVRPTPHILAIYGVKSTGVQTRLGTATLTADSYYDFNSALIATELQRFSINKSSYAKLMVAPNAGGNSLDAFLLYNPNAVAEKRPQVIFTFIPAN